MFKPSERRFLSQIVIRIEKYIALPEVVMTSKKFLMLNFYVTDNLELIQIAGFYS